jgi:hypothetical protein
MNAFVFQLPNHPGELVKVTEAVAARGVNLLVYDLGPGDPGAVGLVASDDETTRSTLGDLGVTFREIPVLTVRMEDKPGQAANTSRRLAERLPCRQPPGRQRSCPSSLGYAASCRRDEIESTL